MQLLWLWYFQATGGKLLIFVKRLQEIMIVLIIIVKSRRIELKWSETDKKKQLIYKPS